jgi:hypothetical protein
VAAVVHPGRALQPPACGDCGRLLAFRFAADPTGLRGRYFEQIPSAGERGGAAAQTLGRGLFPAGAAGADTVRAAEERLARTDLTPPLRRHLADGLEDLRRALAHRR